MLRFQNGAKIKKLAKTLGVPVSHCYTFDLPAGWTCPQASDCLSKADRLTGKIKDGPNTKFRCFKASLEAAYPAARKYVWEMFDEVRRLLKEGSPDLLADALDDALPDNAKVVRPHTGGDMFNRDYALAWAILALRRPDVRFYFYTKSRTIANSIDWPDNVTVTISVGGKEDHVPTHHIRSFVVSSVGMARAMNLETDWDDSHAYHAKADFALVVHGTQPKGGHKLPIFEEKL